MSDNMKRRINSIVKDENFDRLDSLISSDAESVMSTVFEMLVDSEGSLKAKKAATRYLLHLLFTESIDKLSLIHRIVSIEAVVSSVFKNKYLDVAAIGKDIFPIVTTTLENCLSGGVNLYIQKCLGVYGILLNWCPDFLGDEVDSTVDVMLETLCSKKVLSHKARQDAALIVLHIGAIKNKPSSIDRLFQAFLSLLQGVELTMEDDVANADKTVGFSVARRTLKSHVLEIPEETVSKFLSETMYEQLKDSKWEIRFAGLMMTKLLSKRIKPPQSSDIINMIPSLLKDPNPLVQQKTISLLLVMFDKDVIGTDWSDKDALDVFLPQLLDILKPEVHNRLKLLVLKTLTKLIQICNPLILTAYLKVILVATSTHGLLNEDANDLKLVAPLSLARVAEVSSEELCTQYFNKFDQLSEKTRTFARNHENLAGMLKEADLIRERCIARMRRISYNQASDSLNKWGTLPWPEFL